MYGLKRKFCKTIHKQKTNSSQALKYQQGKIAHKHTLMIPSPFLLGGPTKAKGNPKGTQSCSNFDFQADVFQLPWAQKGKEPSMVNTARSLSFL